MTTSIWLQKVSIAAGKIEPVNLSLQVPRYSNEGDCNPMIRKLFYLCVILIASQLIGCTSHPTVDSGSIEVRNEDISARVAFNEDDRERIVNYFRDKEKSKKMPPGLAKKDTLPPGLQKHIVKHGELPPGLEGRSLPYELEKTLTTLPRGFVRLKVGGDVVLMNEKTRVVLDVIWGIE